MAVPYTQYGPFTDNAAPGISSAFLNALETFLVGENSASYDANVSSDGSGNVSMQTLKLNLTGITVSGTTSGTATLYQFLQGTIKAFYLYYNGYRNSTATEQKITLPRAFTGRSHAFANGGIPPTHLYLAGAPQSFSIVTTLPSGTGAGGITTQTAINGYSSAEVVGPFDSVGLGISQSMTFTSGLFVLGV